MTTYDVTLIRSVPAAEGTLTLHFRKPAGFSFKPGQAVDLTLSDPANPVHTFSIVSAPFEDELVFATRMRDSAYKQVLRALPPGAPARIDGPWGSFVLHKDGKRPAVFVAGGIGITPFMSMLRHAAHEQAPRDLLLLYSNRRPEDAAFLGELQGMQAANRRFRLVATMTELGKSREPWTGETERIDAAFIRRGIGAFVDPVYYVVGPPAMVEGMRKVLEGMGIDDEDVRSEDFFGY